MSDVLVVIPTRGKLGMLTNCLTGLFKSVDPARIDVVVMEQAGEEALPVVAEHAGAGRSIRWMKSEDGWSFSKINNEAVLSTPETIKYILLLNDDTVPRAGFLDEMLKCMELPGVAVVGAKLLFPQKTIQHIGVVFNSDGMPYHLGWGRPNDGSFAPATRDDYYDAVTFACALIRREVWERVGGLDEAYFFNYEDVDFCLKVRELGLKCIVAHKAVVTHLESQSAEMRQTEKNTVWRNLKILRDRWITTGKLERIANVKLNKQSGRMRDDRLNVAFVPGGRGAGVPWWRIELPARKLAKAGLANVITLYGDEAGDRVIKSMELADVAIFQGYWSEWVHRIAAMGKTRNFRMVYDYDDHPIHISPFAQAYRHFGTQEILLEATDGSKAWLWRDGESDFDINRNVENRQRQLEIFHLVDLVTTTTPPMYSYFKTLNPSVAMLPNMIDFDIYKHQFTLWQRTPGPIRIGWHGGDNHFHDISSIGKPLVEYVNSHDVQLVLFGAFYRGALKGIDTSKVIEEPWVHVEAFPYKLATLGIDVAVIPLADPSLPFLKFNHYKSDIKFLEYSAMRIPSLAVAGRAAYASCVDGENSLTFASDEEFSEKLHQLCTDQVLRRRLAIRAHDWVHEYRDLEKNIDRWMEKYQELAGEVSTPQEVAEVA